MSYTNKSPLTVDNTLNRIGIGKAPSSTLDVGGAINADSTILSQSTAGNTAFRLVEGALIGLDGSSANFLKADASTHGLVVKSNVTNSGTNSALALDTVNSLTGSTNLLLLSTAGTAKWKFTPTTMYFPDGSTMTSAGGGGGFTGGTITDPLVIDTDPNEGILLSLVSNDNGTYEPLLVRQENEDGISGLMFKLAASGASGDNFSTGDRRMLTLNTFGNTYTTAGKRNGVWLETYGHDFIIDTANGNYPVYFFGGGTTEFTNMARFDGGIQFGDSTTQYTAQNSFWTISDAANIQYRDGSIDVNDIRGASIGGSPSIGTSTADGDAISQSQSGATMIPQFISDYNSPTNNYMLFVDDGWNLNYGSTIIFADGHIEVVPDPTNYGANYGGPNYWLGVGCPLNSSNAFYGIPQDANSAAIGFSRCWSFNWISKTFTELTACPYTTVAAGACNTGQGTILVAGATYGTGGDTHGTTGWFLYNISGDSWSLANTSGAPASGKCLSMLLMTNGNILCLGYRGTFGTYDTYEYDPVGDNWYAIADSNLGFNPGSAAGAGPFMNGVKACNLDNGSVYTIMVGPVVTGAGYDGNVGAMQTYNSSLNGHGGSGWSSYQGFPTSNDYIDPDAHEHQWAWAVQTNNHWGASGYGGQNFYFYLGNPKDYVASTFNAVYNIFNDAIIEYVSIMSRSGDNTVTIGANLEGEHPTDNANKFGYFDETLVGGGPKSRITVTGESTVIQGQNEAYPEVIVWAGPSKTSGPLMEWRMGGGSSTPETGNLVAQMYDSFFLLNGQFQLNNNYATGFVFSPDVTNAMAIGNQSYYTYGSFTAPQGLANFVRGINGTASVDGADTATLSARLTFLPITPDITSASAIRAELFMTDNPSDTSMEASAINAIVHNKNARTVTTLSAIRTQAIHNPNPASGHANTVINMVGIHVLANSNPDIQPWSFNAGMWIELQSPSTSVNWALVYGAIASPEWAIDSWGKSVHSFIDNTGTPGNNTANSITGKCKILPAASSVTITNFNVGTSTIVDVSINQATPDATLTQLTWTVAAGSITVYGNAAATAAVQIAWTIKN